MTNGVSFSEMLSEVVLEVMVFGARSESETVGVKSRVGLYLSEKCMKGRQRVLSEESC